MTYRQAETQLATIDKRIERCSRDFLGRACKYRILPTDYGVINYFGSLAEVERFIQRCRWVRELQKGITDV